jgi:hypothetical protein
MGDIFLERRGLRIRGKWYALANLSSVEMGYTKRMPPLRGLGLLVSAAAALMLAVGFVGGSSAREDVQRWSGNRTGERYIAAVEHVQSCRQATIAGVMVAVAGAALLAFSFKQSSIRYQLLIRAVSGEYHTILFADETACERFCDQLTAAMSDAGRPISVDARQLHVHPPSTPHLR